MPVYASEDGYSIKGIAPPDLRDRPEFALAFWQWVVDLGLRAKDNELSRGLDKNGKPLRRISEATRLHRRSAMTPTGKGDPSAPPLTPGRQLSRTRSLLTGRAYPDHAAFWWRFDPWSGDSWARVLEHQRDDYGRDVFGISPKAEAAVKLKAWARWEDLKAGRPIPGAAVSQPKPGPLPIRPGTPGGEMPTRQAWERYFRATAKAKIPSRPGEDYNVILRHIWGTGGAGPAKPVAIAPKPPKPVPKPKPVVTRVAMKPKPIVVKPPAPPKPKPVPPPPAPPPKPRPAPKPAPSAWQWGQPIAVNKPIAERIKLSSAWERAKKLAEIGSYEDTQEALRKAGSEMLRVQGEANAAVARGASEAEKAQYLARIQELQAEARRLKALRDAIKVDGQAKVREILQPPAGTPLFGWTHKDQLTTPESQAALQGARKFLDGLTASPDYRGRGPIEWNTIPASKEQRPYAFGSPATIHLRQDETADQAAHEWGHHFEFSVPGVLRPTQDFLKHRVGNEKPRPMNELTGKSDYKADELGREDDFRKAFGDSAGYVGKEYSDGFTEVIAMGLEKLYTDSGHFAKHDPEYCAFILGILDGSLRKP